VTVDRNAQLASMFSSLHDVAPKRHLHGTHRAADPAETLEHARSRMPAMGITRIADVTGLDRIGVPVALVTRPNSRLVSVSLGKGLDPVSARVSGLMEAVEGFHGERVGHPQLTGSYEDLRRTRQVVDVELLPQVRGRRAFTATAAAPWIEGYDVLGGEPVLVPYDVVHTDYRVPSVPRGSFVMSGNGVASGNHLLEAFVHALCEVIERDALTRAWHDGGAAPPLVDPGTVTDPSCRWVLDRFEQANVVVAIWDITPAAGIATFSCAIADDPTQGPLRLSLGRGHGCHPSRDIALLRALTEAAQTRLTVVAGSRDDLFRLHYERHGGDEADRHRVQRLAQLGGRDFRLIPTYETGSLDQDSRLLLEHLRPVGIERVVVIDLTDPAIDIPVVRVVVPGMRMGLRPEFPSRSAAPSGPRGRRGNTPRTTAPPKVVLFLGPTLPHDLIDPGLECRPPAEQGDVYLACLDGAALIGLVDGSFEQVPSVSHKEILWAMARGIHVLGAASMGALRAAELAAFGMEGMGRIFEAYRDGELTDDDEVALRHAPAEGGYAPLSEPMVNIRATLRAAVKDAALPASTADALENLAKAMFYPYRSFASMIEAGARAGLATTELQALAAWLPLGAVDQKRNDALALLDGIGERLTAGLAPKRTDFEFQWTVYWDALVNTLER
jgi:YcaO-like protein with predicted kinase domain